MGVVYFVIGLLAIRAALGQGQTTDTHGALGVILQQPFGRAILAIVTLGLFGFAAWRMLDALRDFSGHGDDAKGKAVRAGMAIRSLIYIAFGVEAGRIALRGWASGGSGDAAPHWTSRVLDLPFGRILVICIGLGVIGYGIYQVIDAFRDHVTRYLRIGSLPVTFRRNLILICRVGVAARGVVFLIIGYFALQAGLKYNPSEARGVGGALGSVRGAEHGGPILVAIGAGVIAYSIYLFVNSRYRALHV